MKYEFILFDADNTLLDFDENERVSITNTFEHFGIKCTKEVIELYHEINISLWKMLDQGKIEREILLTKRFDLLFEQLGINGSSKEVEDYYRVQLGLGFQLIPGALELCMYLKNAGFKLFIITNGVSNTQHARLNGSNLAPLMDKIFISDEIGYNKPAREFFEYVENNIPNFDKKKALVVGDSLTSDILGGNNYGIDTCFLNPSRKKKDDKIKATYEIQDIMELARILYES